MMISDIKTKKFLDRIQAELSLEKVNLKNLRSSLIELLEYLSSNEGRNDQNCSDVDKFFTLNDIWLERNLPDSFHEIFVDISGALHDTISAPDIAKNFFSTPEQLLKRVREINT
jgi:hypothetical protein